MQPEDRNSAHLWDMLQAARLVTDFLTDISEKRYLDDRLIQSAVERQIEIVGEAARRVSEDLRLGNPEIPWQQIIGMRNVLAHEYGEVVQARLWNLARNDIPTLVNQLVSLLPPE